MAINPVPFYEHNSNVTEKKSIMFKCVQPIYKLEDVMLNKKTGEEVENFLAYHKYRKRLFEEWGFNEVIKSKKGYFVNFYGAPGTGKTMTAHAIAYAMAKKIICVNYAEIESKYVGETAKNLEQLFEEAKLQDAVLLFDEADALLSKRVTDMRSSADVSVNQTRSVLLLLLDQYEGTVIFTTNFISNFDYAFMRRIQMHIKFDLPDIEVRKRLWEHYIPKKMPVDADFNELADRYSGVSGSDISNAVLSAALSGLKKGKEKISQDDFENAICQIKNSKNENRDLQNDRGNIIMTEKILEDKEIGVDVINGNSIKG